MRRRMAAIALADLAASFAPSRARAATSSSSAPAAHPSGWLRSFFCVGHG